jgi:hypothetical protein
MSRPPTEDGLLFTFVQKLLGLALNTGLIAAGIAVAGSVSTAMN